MKNYLCIGIFLFIAVACNKKAKEIEYKTIDVLSEIGSISDRPDTLFHFVEMIPLKMEEGYLLEISQLIEVKYGFVVLDRRSNFVALFNASGDFVQQYGAVGGGPGEYQAPQTIFIKEESLFVYSGHDRALMEYNLKNGTYVGQSSFPVFAYQIEPLNEQELLAYVSNNPADTHFNVYKMDYNGNILNEYFPFDPLKSIAVTPFSGFLYGGESGVYFSQPFDHQIHVYNPDTNDFDAEYNFDFISPEIMKDRENFRLFVQSDYLYNPDRKSRLLRSLFLKNHHKVLFSVYFDTKIVYFIHDLKTKTNAVFSKMVNSPFLNLLDEPVMLNDKNELYFPVSNEQFSQSVEQSEYQILNEINQEVSQKEEVVYYLLKVRV